MIDTNIIIKLFANVPEVVEYLKSYPKILIPATVIGELYYGAYNSVQIERNESKVDHLSEKFHLIDTDKHTAKEYGKIKSELKKQGSPIPENDIWIAATARQLNLPLLTFDKHFA